MRSALFWKLFVLQLVAAAVMIAGVIAALRLHTAQSFSAFMEEQEQRQLREIAQKLQHAYSSTPDLSAAADSVLETPRRLRDGPRGEPLPDEFNERPRPPRGERPLPHRPPREGLPPPPGEPPVQVQDRDGRYVAGVLRLPPRAVILKESLVVDGVVVGYVLLPRYPPRIYPEEERFSQRQARALWLVGGGALLLAALFAGLIAGMILRPIRRLSAGTASLARREFTTRLGVGSGDELGRLAEDFNRLAEALERYDARQRQWLADIAHELRTPLAVLRGELEAVLDGVRPADSAATRSLHQEVLRLSRLVDDLHLLSMAESGGLALHRAPARMGALLAATVERFRERFATRKFELRLHLPQPDPFAMVDAQRIDQIVANLLENVLRYADPPGPIEVSVSGGPGVQVRVSDGGPGVPEAALPKLFDRLFRTDSARSRSAGGSGLGLAICRSIVEAHGGRITASRSERGGLEIKFTLPAVPK